MDPSMLIAFLIRDQRDWEEWRDRIVSARGTALIRIADKQPSPFDEGSGYDAMNNVETFDEDSQNDDGEMVDLPS